MSPSKFMVYLSTGSAATALELLRRICQPDSASLPHITARYSNLQVRDEVLDHYLGALVDDLLLTEVGTFDDPIDDENGLRTVVVKCESEDLEWLSYKPDFPDSIFHFTVYDGPPSTFASRVLAVMREFPWDLRILGSAERVEPYDKERGTARRNGTLSLTPAAQSVLHSLVPDTRSLADLAELTDRERVDLVRLVCEFLHSAPDVESAKFHPLHLETDRVSRYAGQDSPSWPAAIDELTPATASLPDARETAMFLTPPELAFDVATAATQMMAIKEEVDFGDPAVGPGIFFAALRRVIPFGTIRSATGVEINPSRAHATARRWRRSNLRVVVGDFLTRRPVAQRWNLLMANPPYVRHQEIDRPLGWLREALYQRTGVRLDGRSDIYAYFILSAHDWLAEEGIAAWLIPSEVTSTDFARAIRLYVTSKVTLRRLHTYDRSSPLFDNARVSSTVIIYQHTVANAADVVQITRGGTLERPSETMHMAIDELRRMPKWTWAALNRPSMGVHTTIADIFDVKRGIATGANSHFLLTDHDVERLNVHRRWIRPVLPKSRTILTNVVTSDDSGVPTNVDRLWLIDTAEPFDVIAAESPEFAEYLRKTHSEIGGRTLVAQRKPFYSQERRPPADFAFIYMAKEDVSGERRFIRNESQAVVLNNYVSLTLKRPFLSQIQDGVLTWDGIHKSLRGITSETLSQYGRNYISGLLKLEPTELRSLPLDLPVVSTDKLI